MAYGIVNDSRLWELYMFTALVLWDSNTDSKALVSLALLLSPTFGVV